MKPSGLLAFASFFELVTTGNIAENIPAAASVGVFRSAYLLL